MSRFKLNLTPLVPRKYVKSVYQFLQEEYTYYSFYGGRGSVKSTIGGLLLVLTVLHKGNAIAIRRYGNSLKGSVYQECKKAVHRLGLDDLFRFKISPLEIHCIPTKYTIYFKGLDDEEKIKSFADDTGDIRCVLFEECQEIEEEAKCRSVMQTFARGKHCNIVYVFNPPNAKSHWTNQTLRETTEYLLALKINYIEVPRSWLGEQFYAEAERLKRVDPILFDFEYMGMVGSNKGKVFKNVKEKQINKAVFKTLQRGLDFGLANDGDPTAYVVCHYDEKAKTLYIVDEWYKKDSTYPEIAKAIKAENKNDFTVFCDNADSGGIKQLKIEGVHRAKGCKKGKVENGITWLRGLNHIYIDSERCPETFREFTEYAWVLKKSTGDLVLNEKNNHSIDAVRYALSDFIKY